MALNTDLTWVWEVSSLKKKDEVNSEGATLAWVLIYQPQFKSKRTELWLKELKQEDER